MGEQDAGGTDPSASEVAPAAQWPLGISRRRFLSGSLAAGGLLLAGPGLLAACAGSSGSPTAGRSSGGSAGTPRPGGKATFARTADALSVDPVAVGDNESIWLVSNLYDRLYQSAADGTTVPCLATGHSLGADKLTWTFTLRSGVQFSDGSPLTAADVKYSIDRCTKSDENGYMNEAIGSVSAPDDATVVIKTKYPTELLGVVSYFANGIIPNNLAGKSAKEFFKAPVGTGAFTMTSWSVGQQMVLSRNPHYWRSGLPYLDQITLVTVADDNTRMLQLRGGQADVIEAPPWSQLKSLKSERGVEVHQFNSTIVDFLSLNQRMAQLKDVNVRNAISLAIDRDAIVKVALFGNGQAAGSIFAPTWPDYDASLAAPKRDVAGAKAALSKSGYPNGFTVKHSIDGGDTVQAAVAQLVQSNLADIGVKVSIQRYDSNTLETLVGNGQFEMYHDMLSLDVMDPFENVPYAVDPSVGGDGAAAAYNDPQVIAWSTQAAHTTDAAVQKSAYTNIQQRIAQTSPFVTLYYIPYVYATATRLQGFTVPPTGDYRLENAWVTG